MRSFQGHRVPVTDCTFSPDGRSLISAGDDGTLRVWDAATGECRRIHLHAAQGAAAWEPGTQRLLHASGRAWRYLRWAGTDPDTGRPAVWPLECPPPGVEVKVLPWRPVGARVPALPAP